jgi:hypothetical protein
MVSVLIFALSACNGPNDDGPHSNDSSAPVPVWRADLGPVAVLTDPNGGVLHTHATVAWDDGDRYLVSWTAGTEPATTALAQLFTADGVAAGGPIELTVGTDGDKPDVEWDGARWVLGWNDTAGRVFLNAIEADGALRGDPVLLHDVDIDADAVDLAVQPDGSGIAIWTEFGASWMGEWGGRIVWRAFDAELRGVGVPKLADESSKKTSDAATLPDGGWVGVWSRDIDHPLNTGDFLYEVWARLYRGDGTVWTFRADDLDSAWPSRPAIDARDDGLLAVSWRDKTESEGAGLGSGAYGRLFDAEGVPLGPSIQLGPGHDGDRVVVAWAGELAVYAWQETDPDGLPGVILSAVDAGTQAVVVDRLVVHEPGGNRDERPSIAVRPMGDGFEVLVVWEVIAPGSGAGEGLRARIVSLTPEP